jgi:ParB-like chromosome segregation protein Spo0J
MDNGSSAGHLNINALRKMTRERTIGIMQEAQAYARLLETGKVKNQRELAKLLGVSQARISQRMALLTMPPPVVSILAKSTDLTERHARELRRLKDPKMQAWLAKKIVANGTSVEDTAKIVRSMMKELGADPDARANAGWVPGPSYRWRLHRGWLEVRVKGTDSKARLKILEGLVATLRKNPDVESEPHRAFEE